jgi:hypothetical protein
VRESSLPIAGAGRLADLAHEGVGYAGAWGDRSIPSLSAMAIAALNTRSLSSEARPLRFGAVFLSKLPPGLDS